jgi:hypothetical protein
MSHVGPRPGVRFPAMSPAHEVVAAYWAAAEARDSQRFGELVNALTDPECPEQDRLSGAELAVA